MELDDGEALTALRTPGLEDSPPGAGRHALQKPVHAATRDGVGLIGTLGCHEANSRSDMSDEQLP
jgi:hypothetical protein